MVEDIVILVFFFRNKDSMIKRRVFNFKRPKVNKRFKDFKFKAKSKAALQTLVAGSKKLENVLKKLFNKKTLMAAGVSTAVGLGISSIWDYIESNSGCFMKKNDRSICKVRELSCCQRGEMDNVPSCSGISPDYNNVCDNFDEEREDSCCKLCTCEAFRCDHDETMQCQRPTVAEALTHFAQTLGSGVWSSVEAIFPWISYFLYAIGVIFALWLWSLVSPHVTRLLQRKKNV